MAYIHQPYPKWKYHATNEPRVVYSEADEKALGEGWFDTVTLSGKFVITSDASIDSNGDVKIQIAPVVEPPATPTAAFEPAKPVNVLQEMAKANEAELQDAAQDKEAELRQAAQAATGGVDFNAMTKRQLIDHAAEVHGLQLEPNTKRGDVIAAITAAQSK